MKSKRSIIFRKLILAAVFLVICMQSFSWFFSVNEKGSLVHDNLKRTYIIHYPQKNARAGKLPLIIALHGRGGEGESMVHLTRGGLNRISDREGVIIVYPDGIDKGWNDGRIDEEANDRALKENIDDVGFINALIDRMIGKYNADPHRVYVTGMSNGAIMSYRLACELSGKIAAIAPVAGNIPVMVSEVCHPAKPVSVMAINNVNDPLVPYDGGEIMGHLHRTKLGKVLSVDESVGLWVKADHCKPDPFIEQEPDTDPDDRTTVLKKTYNGGSGGTEVVLFRVDGGGHTWPGGLQYLPAWLIGRTSRDIDANEEIWKFFKKHVAGEK